jgi:hypothetical protein
MLLPYLATGAQLNDSELPTEATAEQRYTLPLHVAFQVPLPSGLELTFDISFSSGRQPVCPALTIFNFLTTIGELAMTAQPAITNTTPETRVRQRYFILDFSEVQF